MDLIKKCFEQYDDVFTEKLQAAGFSVGQAKVFLPETASGIMSYIKGAQLENVIKVLLSDDPAQILKTVDSNAIANTIGMDSDQVLSGFDAIAPVLSQLLAQQSNEIVDATASLAWSPLDELRDSASKLYS